MSSRVCHGVRFAMTGAGHRSMLRSNMALAIVLGMLISLVAGVPKHGSKRPSMVELGVSSHADLMRREAGAAGAREPANIVDDGPVQVVSPAESKSEAIRLEEITEECMQDNPTSECMEKFGSYGVKKMHTESFENIGKLGFKRPGWMSHPEVQKKKLFEVTFPGTVGSGTYAITGEDAAGATESQYGIVSQNFDFYQQLQLGIRMFDLRVSYNSEVNLVYLSHGALMVPLATAIKDMRRFLEEHEREVLILDVRKDENADASHLQPLIDEETTPNRVPGQLVHEAIECELKEMLVTYKLLNKLPSNEMAENPTIATLTDMGANVVLFWNSQQVLCTSFIECKTTPGWHPHPTQAGYEFAFGPPFVMGTRRNVTGGRTTARIIEPACLTHSRDFTKDDQPERMLGKISIFASDMAAKAGEARPKCFPAEAAIPATHTPTLLYTVDGFVIESKIEQTVQNHRMQGVKAIYTKGEGYTARTDAERTNYLLLSWFLKKDNQELFMRPNAMMMEYAGSAYMPIIRLIEAEQGRPECGFAIYCKVSSSCWADTLLGPDDECLDEKEVLRKLEEHAEGGSKQKWIIYGTIVFVSTVFFCCLIQTCGTVWAILHPPPPKAAEEAFTAHGTAHGEDDAKSAAESSLPGSSAASDYGDLKEVEEEEEGDAP